MVAAFKNIRDLDMGVSEDLGGTQKKLVYPWSSFW
jgi:hypothetical protein